MSIKKLQDLLNSNARTNNDLFRFQNQPNRSPSTAQAQFSPLGTNLASNVTRSPSYPNIPGVQNIFYHPLMKLQQDPVCPSPMFQIPTKKPQQGLNSGFHASQFTAAETNPSTFPPNFEINNNSHSMTSLFNQFNPQTSSQQPRNLEELLQKSSFSSMPSNSMCQSPFNMSMQSPFMGGANNNPLSQVQPSFSSEISNLLNPLTLLETSLQKPNLLNNQPQKSQSLETVNKGLILQLAQILKQESESKIKSAIAELILKYRALGLLNNISGNDMVDLQNLISSTEASNNLPYQYPPQEMVQVPQQAPLSLSGGITMNAVPRMDFATPMSNNLQNFKQNFQSARVETTRRELFAMNEIPVQGHPQQQFQRLAPAQDNFFHQEHNFPTHMRHEMMPSGLHPLSALSNLDNEMSSLTLNNNMNSEHFSALGISTAISVPEKMDDLANEDLGSLLKQKMPSDREIPGIYDKQERINKILKYKNKIRKWRVEHPVKRIFKGRSMVAGQKPRIKGKFVTQDEYQSYVTYAVKQEYGTLKAEEM